MRRRELRPARPETRRPSQRDAPHRRDGGAQQGQRRAQRSGGGAGGAEQHGGSGTEQTRNARAVAQRGLQHHAFGQQVGGQQRQPHVRIALQPVEKLRGGVVCYALRR